MLKEHEFRIGRSCGAAVNLLRQPRESKAPDAFDAWTRAETGRVKALAAQFFPGVVDLAGRNSTCVSDLARTLLAAGTPVAGARFANHTASCVIDFACLTGTTLRIYQVIPKSIDLHRYRKGLEFTSQHGGLRAEWRGHLQTMALRLWILEKQAGLKFDRVLPFFILPINGAVSKIEGLHGRFVEIGRAWKLTAEGAAIPAADFLRQVGVANECAELIPVVAREAIALDAAVGTAVPDRRYACKKCEVFKACWGPLANVTPHLFDLGYLWFAMDKHGNRIADTLIREDRVSLRDIPEDKITGEYAQRQRMQLESERTGEEIILPGLKVALDKLTYPVFGLDIETIRSVVPVHRGANVNGFTPIQLSGAEQREPGGPLVFHDWLNTARENPNREFLAALRSALGDHGSVLVYTQYEETAFRELLCEFISAGDDSDDVLWLKRFLDSGRLVDLHRILFENFHAPGMGGKTSIKRVLPALWAVDSPVKRQAPFDKFPADLDPYAYLKSIGGVTDGCGAMEQYVSMQNAVGEAREQIANALRSYVRVDALAMNFILEFWRWRLAEAARVDERRLVAA